MPIAIVETRPQFAPHQLLGLGSIEDEPGSWLVVTTNGRVARLAAGSDVQVEIGRIDSPLEVGSPWRNKLSQHVHVSANGQFLAVVNDYGQRGRLFDLRRERMTLELNGGYYNPGTVPFSFCFLERRGRTLAIHRTDWNRLDISDAETGERLTQRGPTRYHEGEPRPEHYLDYFHGRLLLSPAGTRIADDGWVWHPVGIPETWEIGPWLESNVWESEDGPSKLTICARNYYWDHAMCWLDNEQLAVGGLGEDDDDMVDGARVFAVNDVTDWETDNFFGHGAREVIAFVGPAGRFFGDGSRLFSVDNQGLSVWDVHTGSRLERVEGFVPTHQHKAGHELLQVTDDSLRRWRY